MIITKKNIAIGMVVMIIILAVLYKLHYLGRLHTYCVETQSQLTDSFYDTRLRHEILTQNPGLENLINTDPLKASQIIMNWVSNHLVFAFNYPATTNVIKSPGRIYYQVFKPYNGAVYCCGAADFLAKTLQLFGYKTFTVDSGIPDTFLTHVMTVLALPKPNDKWEYYLLDPTFNTAFFDKQTKQMVPIASLIKYYHENTFSKKVIAHEGDLSNRIYMILFDGGPLPRNYLSFCSTKNLDTSPDPIKYLCKSNKSFFHTYCKAVKNELGQYHVLCNQELDLFYLTNHIFHILNANQPDALSQFETLIATSNLSSNKKKIKAKNATLLAKRGNFF